MKSIKIAIAIAVLTTLILSSCSEDDTPTAISATDLTTTIDENPMNGDVVGTITTNIAGTFSIISQSPSGAFAVDSQSGELTVANAALFDFETNPNLQAVVVAAGSGTESLSNVNVTLSDIDDIAFLLSDSETSYLEAANGDWVEITGDEYISLSTRMNEVNQICTTDEEYNMGSIGFIATDVTTANQNASTIPANSYVFAFKYLPQGDAVTTTKIKQSSTDIDNGYADLGNVLPSHDSGERFFVIKGNNAMLPAEGFLAIYQTIGIGYLSITGSSTRYKFGDSNTLELTSGVTILYQGLSTTQKQWD